MKNLNLKQFVQHFCLIAHDNGSLVDFDGQSINISEVTPKLLDKVIWLVPPQRCLFKQLQYDVEYVAAGEIEECVRSDIEQWTIWPETDMFHLYHKAGQQWHVSVWIWNQEVESGLMSCCTPTHVLPYSAYLASSMGSGAVVISHVLGQDWLVVKDENDLVHGVHSVDSPLSQHQLERRYERQLESGQHIFKYGYSGDWLTQAEPLVLKPKNSVINAGKQKGVIDFADVSTYVRPFGALALATMIWMLGDYLLVTSHFSDIKDQTTALGAQTRNAVAQRNHFDFVQNQLAAFDSHLIQQHQPMQAIAELTESIPEDIYLTALEVSPEHLVLSGQGVNVARLPAMLEQWEAVESAVFVSDIRQGRDNSESFRLQVELKGVTP
ncbi:PilN domain-containing protein [Photobacterium sp. BZF1]|uniref:PilN domain-containing protein n=1 Tax=Photobacterium sp. BZF1 TaxID=1904457 RepID=UPI001653E7EB|nr:PilN domain-containing protein [Photobacterium sp. BZF1]MBC7002111.1 PilN domain-containing protein [Photobacterium sp. BZF1]